VLQPEREQLAGTAGARPTHLRHYHARPHTRHLGLQHAHNHRPQPARHGQSHQHCPPGYSMSSRAFFKTKIREISFLLSKKCWKISLRRENLTDFRAAIAAIYTPTYRKL
jgi:hypothetical protein